MYGRMGIEDTKVFLFCFVCVCVRSAGMWHPEAFWRMCEIWILKDCWSGVYFKVGLSLGKKPNPDDRRKKSDELTIIYWALILLLYII